MLGDDFRTSEACCKSDTANHCGLHTFAYRSAANAKQRNDSEKHAMCASSCSSQCPNSIFLNQWRANTHTQSQEQRWSKYVYSICLTGLPIASLQLKNTYHHIDVNLLIPLYISTYTPVILDPESTHNNGYIATTKTQYHPSCLGLGQTFGYFRIRFLH